MASPYDQYDVEIESLIRQGYSQEQVFNHLVRQYPELNKQAAELLKYIQALE